MANPRDSGCPLCGAKLTAEAVLDTATELVDATQGILAASCPHCQGYFELRPDKDIVELGYTAVAGKVSSGRFDVVLTLPCEGLVVLRSMGSSLMKLKTASRSWTFQD